MPHHRHTIPVATSALLFVCLMLHAQASPASQAFTPCKNAEAYKVYESLLPNDWTATLRHGRRFLIGSESAALFHPLFHSFVALDKANWLLQPQSNLAVPYVLEKTDGLWKNMRWMGTSRAWAS
jgi:hypothetical protein